MLPATRSAPIVARTQKLAVSDATMTRRRGSRSATIPPTSSVEICASVQAANESPTYVAEPVRPRTANATAIGARFVPRNELVRAAKRSRKFRSRRTSTSPSARTRQSCYERQRDRVRAAPTALVARSQRTHRGGRDPPRRDRSAAGTPTHPPPAEQDVGGARLGPPSAAPLHSRSCPLRGSRRRPERGGAHGRRARPARLAPARRDRARTGGCPRPRRHLAAVPAALPG